MKEKYVVCGKGFPNVGQHTAYPGFSLPQYYFLGSLSGGGLKNVLLDCCLVLEGNLKVHVHKRCTYLSVNKLKEKSKLSVCLFYIMALK